jgi:hypothetical protein
MGSGNSQFRDKRRSTADRSQHGEAAGAIAEAYQLGSNMGGGSYTNVFDFDIDA